MELLDNELMFKVKQGDLDQMALLFDRHHRKLFGFFCHQTGSRHESEDLVQTVFMNMLRSRATFTGSHKFETWMYAIARNALHDYHRRTNKQPAVTDDLDQINNLTDTSQADDLMSRKEEMKQLRIAMGKLSEEDRELIILSRYLEMKYQDIAALMNITEGAIKVRIHRAVKQLRTIVLSLNEQTLLK